MTLRIFIHAFCIFINKSMLRFIGYDKYHIIS